jgi:hypothetical protein
MKFTLTFNEKQAQVLMSALEFYSRVHMGQFHVISDEFRFEHEFNQDNAHFYLDRLREMIFPELESNEYYGIYNDIVGPGQEAWDIYQVIRHARAWKRHPEGGWTVDFSTPIEAGKEPLPEITVEDD